MEPIIKKAIGGVVKILLAFPKGDTILLWLSKKVQSLGIKGKYITHANDVMLVALMVKTYSNPKNTTSSFATSTIGNLKSTDILSAMRKLEKNLEHLNLSGLANSLGTTKEGVQRLIWLLEDARNTNNGSEVYSSETISLVRNALLKERILKQTTILLDSPLSWTKKESLPTSRQWKMNDYGIKTMDEPFVVNVTGI